jgi:dTMP kinase
VFLSFEGVDGSGKTTQIDLLAASLEDGGRSVRVFREPGGTELGERIRELLLSGGEVVPWAEVSLFGASRAQLVDTEIRPALEAGYDVICDRYLDSSVAYQGIARGLGEDAVRDWNLRVTGGLLPDLTFLLALPAEDAAARITPAPDGAPTHERTPDRLERESLAFRQAVEAGYHVLARQEPERIVSVDATLPADAIAHEIRGHVDSLLGARLRAR